jgi:hypothetical protein
VSTSRGEPRLHLILVGSRSARYGQRSVGQIVAQRRFMLRPLIG